MQKTSTLTSIIAAFLLSAPLTLAADAPQPTKKAGNSSQAKGSEKARNSQFEKELTEFLKKTDSSISLIRYQITKSTNAPFLADLYQQLGELLLQKANALYFLHTEQEGAGATGDRQEIRPVTSTQKEAVVIFERILRDFPNYEKIPNTLFLLAVSLKALDNTPRFIQTVQDLTKRFPDTKEAHRGRLLMGMHLTERQIYDEALNYLEPVRRSKFVFEKNLAKYRIGLVYLAQEKAVQSLKMFEEVVVDPELEAAVAASTVKDPLLMDKQSENLKREALIDSIRVYTVAHAKNPKPVEYYLGIAPSEELFQEVIEKLAFRYITIKQYPQAIELFRVLSQRISDPERVVNIFRDVLLSIPPKERIAVPPKEVRLVIQKLDQWLSYFSIPAATRRKAILFFELQVRDLGTRCHEAAKAERHPGKKDELLSRARDYYLIHLQFFPKNRYSAKMATNLGDIYFQQKDYLNSGEWYLRTYEGEFGKSPQRKELIKNAVYALQQTREGSYYDQMRSRGRLLHALNLYQREAPEIRRDPKIRLVILKTRYEQGFYDETLGQLYQFVRDNRGNKYAPQAAELILDFYNLKNDMKGLTEAAGRILGLRLADKSFNARLAEIQKTATFKRIEQKIQQSTGYSGVGAAKEYLSAAMSLGDAGLKDAALKEALASSRKGRDLVTYFKTGELLAMQEKNSGKRGELITSIATEHLRLARFGAALGFLSRAERTAKLDAAGMNAVYTEKMRIALLLRDLSLLEGLASQPRWAQLPPDLKKRTTEIVQEYVASGVPVPERLLARALEGGVSDGMAMALFKVGNRLPRSASAQLHAYARTTCARGGGSVCHWLRMGQADAALQGYLDALAKSPPNMGSLEGLAGRFPSVEAAYRAMDGSGDPYLDMYLAVKTYFLYSELGRFLEKTAKSTPDATEVLMQKANESMDTARKYLAACGTVAKAAAIQGPQPAICDGRSNPNVSAYLRVGASRPSRKLTSDPSSERIVALQKSLLVDEDRAINLGTLGNLYLSGGAVHQAIATASLGLSQNIGEEDEFKRILGCGLAELGLENEARFHLQDAKVPDERKAPCLAKLR